MKGPRAVENAATLRQMSKWQVGAGSDDPPAFDRIASSATRSAERYSVDFGFVCCSSRLSRPRPRASLLAKDYPCSCSDPPRLSCWAFSWSLVAPHLAVETRRLPQGILGRKSLPGASRGRDGFAYQYIARDRAWCRLLVQIWLAPAASRLERAMSARVITATV